MKCKKCGSELICVGTKYVCSHEQCDYQEFTSKDLLKSFTNINLAEINDMMESDVPSIIAYEYLKLREFVRTNSIYGAQLQIKDLLEVIIKFPILLMIADAIQTNKGKQQFNNTLLLLTSKQLSLGDWKLIARDIIKKKDLRQNVISQILIDVDKLYDENSVVTWRNDNIGHGATKPEDSAEFISNILNMIDIIISHFKRCMQSYRAIKFCLKHKGEYMTLTGSSKARDIEYLSGTPYVLIDGRYIEIDPLIQYIEHGVYFFDSYQANKKTLSLLCYPNGKKIKQKPTKIEIIYKGLNKNSNILLADATAEGKIYLRSQSDAINRISEPCDYIKFSFVDELVNEIISNNDKGITLLQMSYGMGKTTYSKSKDNLYNGKSINSTSICRGYYINDVFSYSPSSFISKITDLFRQTNEKGNYLEGEFPHINEYSIDVRQDIAAFLNSILEFYRENFNHEKLIFIIDGIDEIKSSNGLTIFDLIPNKNMINNGIYIIITSRTDNQISAFTKSKLDSLPIDNRVSITPDNPAFRSAVELYLRKHIDVGSDSISKIMSITNGNLANIDVSVNTCNELGPEAVSRLSYHANKNILGLAEKLYGERYFKEFLYVYISLSLSLASLTAKQLAILCNEDVITFKILCYLEDLKPLIVSTKTTSGILFSINDSDAKDIIFENYRDTYTELSEIWCDEVCRIVDENSKIPFDDNDVSLILNILNIMVKYDFTQFNRRLKSKVKILLERVKLNLAGYVGSINDQLYQQYYLFFISLYHMLEDLIIKEEKFDDIYLEDFIIIAHLLAKMGDVQFSLLYVDTLFKLLVERKYSLESTTRLKFYDALAIFNSRVGNKYEAEEYYNMSAQFTELILNKLPKEVKYNTTKISLQGEKRVNEAIHYKNRNMIPEACQILDKQLEEISIVEKEAGNIDINVLSIKYLCLKTYGNVLKRSDTNHALNYYNEASIVLSQINDIRPEFAKAYESDLLLNQGQAYRQIGAYNSAMECYKKAIEINNDITISGGVPNNVEICKIYNSMGNIERDQKHPQRSIDYYSKAISIGEQCRKDGKNISDNMLAEMYVSRAQAHRAMGALSEEKRDMDYIRQFKIDEELLKYTSQAKANNEKDSSRHTNESLSLCEFIQGVNKIYPEFSDSLNMALTQLQKSEISAKQKRYEMAIKQFYEAIKILEDMKFDKIGCVIQSIYYDLAEVKWQVVSRLSQRDEVNLLKNIKMQNGLLRLGEIAEDYTRSTESILIPDKIKSRAYNKASIIYCNMYNDLEKAKIYAKYAIDTGSEIWEGYSNLGNAYLKGTEYKAAYECYLKTLNMKPDHYIASGNIRIAKKYLNTSK